MIMFDFNFKLFDKLMVSECKELDIFEFGIF